MREQIGERHPTTVPAWDGGCVASAAMLWRRPDGDLVRDVPPTKAIMPYLMRGRNESAVYFEQKVAMRHADAYVREFNVAHPDTPITIQHLVMWTITQILDQYPTMNRFVVGGRLYQRRGIWFTYSAKQSLKGRSPMIVIKRRFDPAESFVDMVRAMQAQLREDKYGGTLSPSDAEAALILRFPGLVRRLILAVGRFGDAFGLLPGSMIEHDPMYASVFFANLASIGHRRLLPPPLRVRQHRHLRGHRPPDHRSGLPHQRARPPPHHDPQVDVR